jgi:hypothetical protein
MKSRVSQEFFIKSVQRLVVGTKSGTEFTVYQVKLDIQTFPLLKFLRVAVHSKFNYSGIWKSLKFKNIQDLPSPSLNECPTLSESIEK